jgi:hypothetical protein
MAASQPPVCLRLSGVDLQPRDDQPAMDGLNTRFDIYANGFQACKDNYVVVMRNDARSVPVAGFGKFFLTLPAASGASLYAEFLGLIKPTDENNHDMVQLYR